MIKKILILLFVIAVLSCQDSKGKKTESKKVEEKENSTQLMEEDLRQKLLSEDKKEERVRYDTITKIKQEKLKPFLEKYGQENRENRVVVKTDYGDIEIELYRDTPWHRANFIRLVKLEYFNTTYFYRVSQDFVIQAGNSDNKITGQLRKAIGDFLIPNEFYSKYRNVYGAVGAAKFSQQNVSKASSPFEFYILMDKEGAPHLDNEHTVFGRVVKGMDVAEKINKVKTDQRSEWPVENIWISVEILE